MEAIPLEKVHLLINFKINSLKSNDYHRSMKSEKFYKWLEEEILPKLESQSIIVMDKETNKYIL